MSLFRLSLASLLVLVCGCASIQGPVLRNGYGEPVSVHVIFFSGRDKMPVQLRPCDTRAVGGLGGYDLPIMSLLVQGESGFALAGFDKDAVEHMRREGEKDPELVWLLDKAGMHPVRASDPCMAQARRVE